MRALAICEVYWEHTDRISNFSGKNVHLHTQERVGPHAIFDAFQTTLVAESWTMLALVDARAIAKGINRLGAGIGITFSNAASNVRVMIRAV